jgi:hypothetical protein
MVYKWNGRKFVFDIKAMKNPKEQKKDLSFQTDSMKEQFTRLSGPAGAAIGLAPPELADAVLGLYYAGHARLARKFFDDCWPHGRFGKKYYWEFLMVEARKSKYWPAVRAVNGLRDR